MRVNVRDTNRLGSYTEKLDKARANRQAVLEELISRMSFVEHDLTSQAERLETHLQESRRSLAGGTWSVQWAWRAHRNPGKVMPLEVNLVTLRTKGGQADQRKLSLRPRDLRVERLTPYIGSRAAKQFSRDLDRFLVLANTVVRWINVLAPAEAVAFNTASWNYGLDRWVTLVGGACEKAAHHLAGVVEEFLSLDAELDDLVFEFNGAAQPVRFHSIICRRECPSLDLLAPAMPRFRVVVSINRTTGRRNSRDVQLYKTDLAARRLKVRLARELGREPTSLEIKDARERQRQRSPTPWLSKELIQHCWLGKHSAGLLRHQRTMVAVMDRWNPLRTTIQSLL